MSKIKRSLQYFRDYGFCAFVRAVFNKLCGKPIVNNASNGIKSNSSDSADTGAIMHSTSANARAKMPSVWFARYSNKNDYDKDDDFHSFSKLTGEMDNETAKSIRPFEILAYCEVCKKNTLMRVCYEVGALGSKGVQVGWSEDIECKECGLRNRQRALIDFLVNKVIKNQPNDVSIYLAEALTPTFAYLSRNYKSVIGSEFFGQEAKSGESYAFQGKSILHQDLTQLSFNSESFDVVITHHVFEHIPDYKKAFMECYRVLKRGGELLFTIPFFIGIDDEKTIVRASVNDEGVITHIHPPELHGNPVDSVGSLCFQNFGWDILDCLRSCGFKTAYANFYWGRWKGYIGEHKFNVIFSAYKE